MQRETRRQKVLQKQIEGRAARIQLHLGKVSDQVTARVVGFSHDVKEEGFNVVVQSLVVQEELGQQAQILTVDLKEGENRHLEILI